MSRDEDNMSIMKGWSATTSAENLIEVFKAHETEIAWLKSALISRENELQAKDEKLRDSIWREAELERVVRELVQSKDAGIVEYALVFCEHCGADEAENREYFDSECKSRWRIKHFDHCPIIRGRLLIGLPEEGMQ